MRKLTLYQKLDRYFPTSYRLKLFFVGSVGTHLPLLTLVIYLIMQGRVMQHGVELLVALAATLAGTALTLGGLSQILSPIEIATDALLAYRADQTILPLPTGYRDTVGKLMANILHMLVEAEGLISDRERLAFSDSLTGLANRRCFDILLNEKPNGDVTDARQKPVYIAIMDLDHFKQINDLFGHPAGDEVLKCFADVLRRAVNHKHIVARIGGEEFAVVFADSSLDEVDAICQHVRHLIARRRDLVRPVTVSIGVAARCGREELLQTIARADKALYEAKRLGRNRVAFASAPVLRAAE
jgi:diguanylate cyclase (GGDEF)-like protein